MGELLDYMAWKKVGIETQSKVIKYYEVKYRGKFFEEKNLLADMNESLRTVRSYDLTRLKIIRYLPKNHIGNRSP
jgi:hypothetical protein